MLSKKIPGTVEPFSSHLLDAICCTQVFPPPAHHLLSLWGLWDSTQIFSTSWCSLSEMKMNCDHEAQGIGEKCLHPDSSCRTGTTSYLLLWNSKLLSWVNTQQPQSLPLSTCNKLCFFSFTKCWTKTWEDVELHGWNFMEFIKYHSVCWSLHNAQQHWSCQCGPASKLILFASYRGKFIWK